jgi:chorismate synthase
MPRLEYTTAGESHGPALIGIVSGLPAGLAIDAPFVDAELKRRQGGYGRGARQKIEQDTIEILSGLHRGLTIGSPLAFRIPNRDSRLDDADKTPPVHRPRPGHADLAGSLKYLTTDCRPILERASARETAVRTACGAIARCMLRPFGIESFGFVRSIRDAVAAFEVTKDNLAQLATARNESESYCPDPHATRAQCDVIRQAKIEKDTVGGIIETHIFGCPPGLGSCMDWRDKLDARLAFATMSIQAIKSVEIGLGREVAFRPGSQVHDAIGFDPALADTPTVGFTRSTNNAGGTEGGMTNGQPIVIRAAMKPISTLLQGMPSIDLNTRAPEVSTYERSDICAVPAASVVLENVTAFEVAAAFRDKFGGDTMDQVRASYDRYFAAARSLGR